MVEPPFEDMVEVGRYPSVVEASIISNRLESEGISIFLADAETIGVNLHMHQALGGVKIFTPQREAEFAKQLIADWQEDVNQIERPPEDPSQRILRVATVSVFMWPLSVYSLPLSLKHLQNWAQLSPEDRRKTTKAITLSSCAFALLILVVFLV